MLKFIFWSLLLVNGALFAYGQGYLGKSRAPEREPARMQNQTNADKIALISASAAQANAEQARSAIESARQPEAAPATIACTEIGDFAAGDAKRIEAQLAALALGERQSRIEVPVTEVTQHVVYIPSLGSKEAAERKAAELKAQGVSNYYIMPDSSPLKWGISLGVFKSEAAAQTLLRGLVKQGVKNARIVDRGPTVNRLAYRFRDIDAATRAKLTDIGHGFKGAEVRACKP